MDQNSPFTPPPPAYNDTLINDVSEKQWDPTILLLSGLTIHAESLVSAPLYQLNRAVAVITASTKQVEFSRIEHSVSSSTSEPVIKLRPRHLYNLKYLDRAPGGLGAPVPPDSPCAYVQSVSRRTLGNYGMKKDKPKSLKSDALPIDVSGKHSTYQSLPSYIKKAKPLFQVVENKEKTKTEWIDGDGNAVAVEDNDDGQHKLVITASLQQKVMDVLVALWCCRTWQRTAETTERVHEGMEGIRRRFRFSGEIRPSSRVLNGQIV